MIYRTAVAATDDQNLSAFRYIKQMVGIWTFSRLRHGCIINYMFSDVTEKTPGNMKSCYCT